MRYFVAILLVFGLLITVPVQAFAEDGVPGDSAPAAGEPDASPEPSPAPEAVRRVKLTIDNENIYKDMAKSYSQGYIPSISGGYVTVVLPLLCDGELKDNELRAAVTLGDASSSPFVGKNYEKTISIGTHEVNGGKKTVKSYCISFSLQLKSDRYNGTYPVLVRISGEDTHLEDVTGDFTVFVTITDGKDPNAVPTPEPVKEEEVILGPKILVQSVEAESLEEEAEPGKINAGDKIQVKITLENTSKTEGVENMTVTAGSPGDGFLFTGASDSTYIGNLAAGGKTEIIRTYTVKPETPAGQYEIPVSFDFAYGKGMTGSGSGTARVEIRQPLEMEFSLLQMPAEAVVSDTVEVGVQAINLSRAKAYNVRATIEGDGLSPAGTAFIGDLEGGTAQKVALQVLITGLAQGNSFYGPTEGKITYQYEDGEGTEYSLEETFPLNILSPFSDTPRQPEDEPGQWWIIMAVIGGAVLLIAVFLAARKIGRHRAR